MQTAAIPRDLVRLLLLGWLRWVDVVFGWVWQVVLCLV